MQDEFLRLQGVLRKTIIFITHDFDEAIRLADRIAIMKDGAIIQIGTPEELVTDPATDYVAEFTREIPRAKVLSARSVMAPATAGETFAGSVTAETKIQDLAAQAVAQDAPLAVTNGGGAVIGRLGREAVLDVLVGGAGSEPDAGSEVAPGGDTEGEAEA